MADWCSIKVQYDSNPPTPEAIEILAEKLQEMDYDFPVECLAGNIWCSYRSPMIEPASVVVLFVTHGLTGRYWLSSCESWDAEEDDYDCVVFHPNFPLNSVQEAHQEAKEYNYLVSCVKQYIKITSAFNIPPMPINWQAIEVLQGSFSDRAKKLFEELLTQNSNTSEENQ